MSSNMKTPNTLVGLAEAVQRIHDHIIGDREPAGGGGGAPLNWDDWATDICNEYDEGVDTLPEDLDDDVLVQALHDSSFDFAEYAMEYCDDEIVSRSMLNEKQDELDELRKEKNENFADMMEYKQKVKSLQKEKDDWDKCADSEMTKLEKDLAEWKSVAVAGTEQICELKDDFAKEVCSSMKKSKEIDVLKRKLELIGLMLSGNWEINNGEVNAVKEGKFGEGCAGWEKY